MSTAKNQPEIPDGDPFPVVELKRMPNNEMGVLIDFQAPEPLRSMLGTDVLGMNIEPKRARRLRDQLNELLDVLGLGLDPERYSRAPVDKLALSDLRAQVKVEKLATDRVLDLARRAIGYARHTPHCETENRDWPGKCSCHLAALQKEIEGL